MRLERGAKTKSWRVFMTWQDLCILQASDFQTVYLRALRFCRFVPPPGTLKGPGSEQSEPHIPNYTYVEGYEEPPKGVK